MTVTTAQRITFEEYLSYEDGTDKRYEFNDGELVVMTPATVFHNDLMMFFVFFLQSGQLTSYLHHAKILFQTSERFEQERP